MENSKIVNGGGDDGGNGKIDIGGVGAASRDGDKVKASEGEVKESGSKRDFTDSGGPDTTDAAITGRATYRRPVPPVEGVACRDATSALYRYNFDHRRRGHAVIVNNRIFDIHLGMEERRGTDRDADNLTSILSHLGFEVTRKDNRSRDETLNIVKTMSRSDHTDCDCFLFIILSHGEDGIIYSTDDKIYLHEITQPFRPNTAPSLAGKPKLFFFQACRGHELDHGHDVTDNGNSGVQRIPVMADFLFAYSVVPGYFSWRNSEHGSWFVQALCHVFKDHHEHMDLMSMLTVVNRHVALDFQSNASDVRMTGKKQVPSIMSTLTRDVWFLPKMAQQ